MRLMRWSFLLDTVALGGAGEDFSGFFFKNWMLNVLCGNFKVG